MLRECDINEISDGKRYQANDLVKLGCNDCKGCHSCCEGMEDTIVLDPYDIYRLTRNLEMDFTQLMQGRIALHVEEGLILPHLAMSEAPCRRNTQQYREAGYAKYGLPSLDFKFIHNHGYNCFHNGNRTC